jgi:uncharacterized protein
VIPLLSDLEQRVLGTMIEKDMATPEYYPLSLNALTNACNQKNNREPVTSYDDETVEAGHTELRSNGSPSSSPAAAVCRSTAIGRKRR